MSQDNGSTDSDIAGTTVIGAALLVTSEQLAEAMLRSAAFHELRDAAARRFA